MFWPQPAFIGDQKLVESLLSSGGKPNTASNLVDTPLQAAATNGQIEIVQIPTEEWRRNQSFFQISPFLLKDPYQRSIYALHCTSVSSRGWAQVRRPVVLRT